MSSESSGKFKELRIAFCDLVTFLEEILLKNNLESCLFQFFLKTVTQLRAAVIKITQSNALGRRADILTLEFDQKVAEMKKGVTKA